MNKAIKMRKNAICLSWALRKLKCAKGKSSSGLGQRGSLGPATQGQHRGDQCHRPLGYGVRGGGVGKEVGRLLKMSCPGEW